MPFFILFFLLSWIMWLPLCVPVEVVHPSIFLSKLRSHCGANTSYHRTCVHPGLSNTGLRQSACSPCTCVGGTLTGRTCRNADFLLSAYACTYWTIFVKSTETEKKIATLLKEINPRDHINCNSVCLHMKSLLTKGVTYCIKNPN